MCAFWTSGDVQKMGGDKVKVVIKVRNGIEIRGVQKDPAPDQGQQDSRCTAAIQGDAVRVTGAKRDDLQAAMALIRKDM